MSHYNDEILWTIPAHITPASWEWLQLYTPRPRPLCGQSERFDSFPVHLTCANTIGPVPPIQFLGTAPALKWNNYSLHKN